MATSDTKKLGAIISDLSNSNDTVKENINPDRSDSQEQMFLSETNKNTGTVTIKRYNYETNAFVLDHVVYGELDSSVLLIDGGYASASAATFPMTFPFTFGGGTASTTLFTTSF